MFNLRHLPLALSATMFLMGCPKKPVDDGTPNPNVSFVQGVETLQKANKKTGEIQYDVALGHFQTAVNLDPNFVNAAYNAGYSAEQLGDYGKAATFYKQAFTIKPTSANLSAATTMLLKAEQGDDALALFKEYLANNPSDMEARYDYVQALTDLGQFEAVVAEASEMLADDKNNMMVYRLLSRSFFQSGQYDMSLMCAEKANEMLKEKAEAAGQPFVEDAGILNNMGVTHLAMKDEGTAIVYFQEALKSDPTHPEANLNLGFIALNSGNYTFALERFEAVLQTQANSLDARIGKAVALRGTQEFGDAEKLYKQLLSNQSTATKTVYFNASTLQAKYNKDYKEAETLLQTFKTNNPTDADVNQRLTELSELQAEEARLAAEAAAKKKAEEERKKRQREKMNELKTATQTLDVAYKAMTGCPEAVESGMVEMAQMIVEQANMVIEADEIDMAGDMLPMISDTMSNLDMLKESCGGTPSAPVDGAPTEGGSEGTEETPAEGAE